MMPMDGDHKEKWEEIKAFAERKGIKNIHDIFSVVLIIHFCPFYSSFTPASPTKKTHSLSGRFGLSINFATLEPFFPLLK